MKQVLLKVKALIGHQKWEDKYVEVPQKFYDKALKEKKEHADLISYEYFFRSKALGLPKYHELRTYIMNKIGYKIDYCIQRINII